MLIQHYLDALPVSIKTAATAEVNGRLTPAFYADGNYYIGFTRKRIIGNSTTPMIGLVPSATPNNIAHEVGHYMNHVLVGDAIYLQTEDLAPDDPHGLRDLHIGRTTITEDYAYFSEYFLTGKVGGSWDPTEPRSPFSGLNPTTSDFPSLEGFGCALLASLQRTSSTVVDVVSGTRTDIPVVGASFSDIFGIIALGATNIDLLRQNIQTYLQGKGEADKLPVILHRIGWRYSGKARFVDQDGAPLGKVDVKVLARVAGSPDYVEDKQTTDSNGEVTLNCFGGIGCYVRIYHDSDSSEVLLDPSNFTKPTTDLLNFGDLVVDTKPMDLSKYIRLNLFVGWLEGTNERKINTLITTEQIYPLTISPNEFSGSFSANTFISHRETTDSGTTIIEDVHVTVDPVAFVVTNFVYSKTSQSATFGSSETVEGYNIPVLGYGETMAYFLVGGTETCNHISTLESRYDSYDSGDWIELKNYNCVDVSRIEIKFFGN